MYCSKCGTKNEDTDSFCLSCGSPLHQAVPPQPADPQMPAPPVAAPSTGQVYIPKQRKPYRAEFSLGLTGAIIGSIMFSVMAIMSILELSGELFLDGEGMITVSSVFCLASFILGFVGSAQINKGNLNGGVSLLVGAGLGFVSMFISLFGLYTLFFWPLLLAGGITALARKATLQKIGEYPR